MYLEVVKIYLEKLSNFSIIPNIILTNRERLYKYWKNWKKKLWTKKKNKNFGFFYVNLAITGGNSPPLNTWTYTHNIFIHFSCCLTPTTFGIILWMRRQKTKTLRCMLNLQLHKNEINYVNFLHKIILVFVRHMSSEIICYTFYV